ncbi:D-lactate dehydrogenase [Marivita geojedonensis]|uniref:Quinone-dependent D-lactate dehydrogenase n=1 Tax=Marivita geojedonensis TaxID=1123756 RepID=A0A1X4NL05_9RHOB|nr:D-lactate dehydrogenase [Marivita geojedonensis]OSQ50965.1 lactate dehydrogenase [Marivita geojedonensis]PRY80043.1 D-lactate dehydrogenase [Marivita geojedonensis]
MTDDDLLNRLRAVVGARHVLTGAKQTERFRKGFRSGEGDALCVVQPATILEQWQVLQACVAADKIVIMQAAKTGLTEGSTPKGTYDRDVVLINTRRMDAIHTLRGGEQVVSLPGATLFALEKLLKPLGRQPHSVIGSSCIGASIVGGVCNNSGGSLIERGPSYTELSLFARITADGELELVNHLGIALGDTPEEILTRVQKGNFGDADLEPTNKRASDTEYHRRVRDVDADSPARFNADKRRLYEAAGCAGKLAVFAVRLDTYPINETEQTFYIGTNDPGALTDLRRHILAEFDSLPVSGEYMHRECFDISETYGKDTVLMIDRLGTDKLPMFFALKGAVDARLNKLALTRGFTDRFMQLVSRMVPKLLPKRLTDYRDRYEHHLILKMRDGGVGEARAFLKVFFAQREGDFFECTAREGKLAGLNRFAAAGAAIRYQNVHRDSVEDILALDIALKRNERNWLEVLPDTIADKLVHRLYYGHFFCHVLHQDYIVKKGVDVVALKAEMLELLDQRGAEYPAEHNVGHIYKAKPDLAEFYKSIDPTNSFNPGIGKMSRCKHYA